MAASFFFYDLETSGLSAKDARIMQFAGQRTDEQLDPIGQPLNILIKLTPDILPDPRAVLLTGITPQQTLADGVTEAEFLKLFHTQVATPDTIFVGYNTVRFDDEFMRYLHYRNFYDPYEWQWQDGKSRWDLLDLVRMTRALRPEGIKWPFQSDGKPSNKLGLIASVNNLCHTKAHDAASDVEATIAVARLIKSKQPKLFNFLLGMRGKKEISKFILSSNPFVYSSGKYPAEYEKTTVVQSVGENARHQGALVFDLRYDPAPFVSMSPAELVNIWRYSSDPTAERLPVKTLQYNRCPAVAPISVLDESSRSRLKLDLVEIKKNAAKLTSVSEEWLPKLQKALDIMDKQRQAKFILVIHDVDSMLYEGFFDDHDRAGLANIRRSPPEDLSSFGATLHDQRLQQLLPLYKARNFPDSLTPEELEEWEKYRLAKLISGNDKSQLAHFEIELQDIASDPALSREQQSILTELQAYSESIMPLSANQ